MKLQNETAVNIASLLREPVGSTRRYELELDQHPLDAGLEAVDIRGELRLTKLADEILARTEVDANVRIVCLRCLQEYDQAVSTAFEEEFRIDYDVRTGVLVGANDGDERFGINAAHELDIAEPLRQELILALPMRPACGADCPGPDMSLVPNEDAGDDRFAALAMLLDDSDG